MSELNRSDKLYLMQTTLLECMFAENRQSDDVFIWLHKKTGIYYIKDRVIKNEEGRFRLWYKFDGPDDLKEVPE